MDQSSQTRVRRVPRPWTDKDQRRAEELRAKGLSYRAIGDALDRDKAVIRRRLDPRAAEQLKEYTRRRYQSDPARDREKCRRWCAANPNKYREKLRRWRRRNIEKCREASRAWKRANRERANASCRRWKLAHKEKVREFVRKRESQRRAGRSAALIALDLSCKESRFLLFGSRCAYCAAKSKLTVDHVLPLKLGGLDEPANIVPACARCNGSKHANPVADWYRRQPFFSEARWRRIVRHCPEAVGGQMSLALPPPASA